MESWRNRKTLILGRWDMIGLLTPAEYVDCVEHAFRMHGLGRVYMEPKGHIVLDRYKGEWEVMPSWIEEPEAAACKWVSIREDNARFDLPAVFSILDLHPSRDRLPARDLRRLVPHADADGRLGRGLGEVARAAGLEGARDPRDRERRRGHARDVRHGLRLGRGARCGAARRSRSTASSPSRHRAIPHLVLDGTTDVRNGRRGRGRDRHGNARARVDRRRRVGRRPARTSPRSAPTSRASRSSIPAILQRGRVFVDDMRQCVPDGEINVPLREGLITEDDIAGEIGKVICGELEGRQSDDQMTVFDSTGIALQDSATVPLEVERAIAAGVGVEKKMIST